MVGCTIAGNTNDGISNGGQLTIVNCTVSGNWYDGGIQNGDWPAETNATIYATNCTIAFNQNGGSAGGVMNAGIFQAQDCIFAGNGTNDFSGVLTSEGYNLIQNTNGCTITNNQTGNIYGVDPLLGPLQDNGGPTWTHALLPGS